jgi:curli biogenesis system outer membrane secretion channel CsgG
LLLPILAGCPKSKPIENADKSNIKWPTYTGKKSRVIVIDFDNTSSYSNGGQFARAAQKMLSAALIQSGRFDVIEGDALKAIIAQQGFQNSGFTDSTGAAQLGKIANAAYVVRGSITELGVTIDSAALPVFAVTKYTYKTTLDISVIAVESAITAASDTQGAALDDKSFRILSFSKTTDVDDSRITATIRDAVDKSAPKIVEKMPYVAGADYKVANVDKGKVTINAEAGAFNPGQQLKVIRRGKEIKDPDSGAVIDYEETEVGVVEVVESKGKITYCKIVSGSGFQNGDVVRP